MPRAASTPPGRRYGEVKHLPVSPVLCAYLLQCTNDWFPCCVTGGYSWRTPCSTAVPPFEWWGQAVVSRRIRGRGRCDAWYGRGNGGAGRSAGPAGGQSGAERGGRPVA